MPDYIIVKQAGPIIGSKKLPLKVEIMKTSYVNIIINLIFNHLLINKYFTNLKNKL
jgi:hypothetical protein